MKFRFKPSCFKNSFYVISLDKIRVNNKCSDKNKSFENPGETKILSDIITRQYRGNFVCFSKKMFFFSIFLTFIFFLFHSFFIFLFSSICIFEMYQIMKTKMIFETFWIQKTKN